MKKLVAATAVILAAMALAGCGEDEGGRATPTAERTGEVTAVSETPETPPAGETPVATPDDGESAGMDGFRAFAADLDGAVKRADVAFIMDRLKTTPVVCTEENTPPQMGGPACTTVGERFDGFLFGAWRSEGSTVPAANIESQLRDGFFGVALPRAGDEFGGGEPQVYAVSDSSALGTHAALLTAIIERPENFAGEGPLRVAIHTSWEFEGERWMMTFMMNAYVLAEEFLRPDDIVRESYYLNWERFAP